MSNSTFIREREIEAEKREPEVQINRKPKRVRLGIDRDHVINGQTKRKFKFKVKGSVLERDEGLCTEA